MWSNRLLLSFLFIFFLSNTNFNRKNVGFSGIRIRIIGPLDHHHGPFHLFTVKLFALLGFELRMTPMKAALEKSVLD